MVKFSPGCGCCGICGCTGNPAGQATIIVPGNEYDGTSHDCSSLTGTILLDYSVISTPCFWSLDGNLGTTPLDIAGVDFQYLLSTHNGTSPYQGDTGYFFRLQLIQVTFVGQTIVGQWETTIQAGSLDCASSSDQTLNCMMTPIGYCRGSGGGRPITLHF
jgi:hypothetical protein